MAFWLYVRQISDHNKLSEAEKLLDLSQHIFIFTMHQSSSSNNLIGTVS